MSISRRLLAAAAAVALSVAPALAQGAGTITGQVTDASTGQPLVGAQVSVAGTTRGAITGQQGRYTVAGVPAGSHEVRATLIGYSQATQAVSLAAGGSATANFALSSSVVELGGVVVTASGREQRTRELGNAVGSINVSDVNLAPVTNTASLLQGRSAGVVVTPSSGTTGTSARIRIRGSNSISLSNEPLLVVDGVRASLSDNFTNVSSYQLPSRLNDINPEDIESIEILKGPAAAALYGTAAANGVIQITTKRGRAGRARWTAYVEQGQVVEPTLYPTSVRSQNGCILLDVAEGDCTLGQVSRDSLNMFNPLEDPDLTPFKDGYRQQYGLSVSGGTEAVTYYLAGELEGEDGVYQLNGVNQNSLDRVSLRANLNSQINSKLNVALRSGYTSSDLVVPQNDNNLYGILLNGLLGSGDREVSQGTYGIPFEEGFAFETGQETRRVVASLNANYQPLEWLSVVATTGLDQVNRHDNEFLGANRVSDLYSSLITKGYRRSNRVEVSNFTGNLDATATRSLGSSLISTTSLGTQYHREEYHDTRAFGRGVAPGTRSLSGTSELYSVSENTVENATLGAYGQQQLAWNDRLYLTAALRGDDNSAFGVSSGFVWYPSVSASWIVSDEPFFPQVGALSNLRLRTAYGKSGLRPSFRDALTYYQPVSVRLGGVDRPAVTLSGTGNPNLRPEISTELELGFDLGLLEDRLGLEVTYYNKESEDALVQRRLSPSLGLTVSRFENIGRVRNRGLEAGLNALLLDTRSAKWSARLSGSTNENRLIQLGEGIEPILMGSNRLQQRHQEGFALGSYWLRPVTYDDANGDGLLQIGEVQIGDTAVYMGQPFPTQEASFSSELTLFGTVTLSGLLDYKGGYQLMNFTRFDRCAWEIVCPAAYLPDETNLRDQAGIIAFNVLEPGVNTSVYVEDGDFLKLRELSLTVGVPNRYTEQLGVQGARLTLSGRNLATWTKYTGFDPEVNSFGAGANFQTYDYYTQPPLRYFTARVDVNF